MKITNEKYPENCIVNLQAQMSALENRIIGTFNKAPLLEIWKLKAAAYNYIAGFDAYNINWNGRIN